MNHIFGPVPSRRLGRSLGVDLVPFKTCSYDCIYCQLGRTTNRIIQRNEWFPLDEIVEELKEKIHTNPDYITLCGSGEPTLYSRIDELIDRIRFITDIPVAVLTNGSLLWQKELRRQLMDAHAVMPSLDAGDELLFDAINRPHPDITFELMLDGLIAFRNEYPGKYWLEVFLLLGHTALQGEIAKIRHCVDRIKPDSVQLNTAVRPTAENMKLRVESRRMEKFAEMFDPKAEVIADFRNVYGETDFIGGRDQVLDLLRRRPCSAEDISEGLGMHCNEVLKHLKELMQRGSISPHLQSDTSRIVYRVVR